MPKTTKRRRKQNRTPEEEVFLDEGLKEIVIDALRKVDENEEQSYDEPDFDNLGAVRRRIFGDRMALLIAFDQLYRVVLVYAYGPYDLYKGLASELYEHKEKLLGPASALCTYGGLRKKFGDHSASLIWVNNDIPLKNSAASWIHEIVHQSQDILKHVSVEDSNGEAQAYLIERESSRILKEFFGLESENTDVPKDMKCLCKTADAVIEACHRDMEKTREGQ